MILHSPLGMRVCGPKTDLLTYQGVAGQALATRDPEKGGLENGLMEG